MNLDLLVSSVQTLASKRLIRLSASPASPTFRMIAFHMPFRSVVLVVSLLLTGSYAASAPFKASEDKPADKLVAAAQSALQKAGKSVSAAQNGDLGLGRHKGDSFTSPVDGYFIQVRLPVYTMLVALRL